MFEPMLIYVYIMSAVSVFVKLVTVHISFSSRCTLCVLSLFSALRHRVGTLEMSIIISIQLHYLVVGDFT